MALWEIRLHEQPSLVVDVHPDRNLAAEFQQLVDAHKAHNAKRWWQRRGPEPDPYWTINEETRIHAAMVSGIQPVRRPRRREHKVIGFRLEP